MTQILKANKQFEFADVQLGYEDIQAVTNELGRKYHCPDGGIYNSITTVLGFRGKDGLKEWRARVGEEEANRVSKFCANRGTSLHSLCDKYLANEDVGPDCKMPHHLELFKRIRPTLDTRIGKIYLREKPLYSSFLKVAGRVDLIAEFDGVLSVVDFKTSLREKHADGIHSYFMQETFYATAFKERTGISVKQIVTVMLCDDMKDPKTFVEKPENWINKLVEEVKYYRKNANQKF
jgi:genome maintenance exonuclease 1